MGAGTYLTTALTAVQDQTEESKQTVEGEGWHPVSFLGPSLLYCDDIVAPSGRCQGLGRVH